MKYSYLETRSLRVNASFIVIAREKYYDIGLQIGKTENAFKICGMLWYLHPGSISLNLFDINLPTLFVKLDHFVNEKIFVCVVERTSFQEIFITTSTPGACIIKLITDVIYGFHNKLECLFLASLSSLVVFRDTLVYYGNRKLRP
jgi:hypothetical protein